MASHVALLRGINVGGRNLIAMPDLRDLFIGLGLSGVKTLLQSGNVVFQSDRRRTRSALERLLESETERRLGRSINYLVRTAAEWQMVLAGNPFSDAAKTDPSHLLVMFLKEAPTAAAVEAVRAAIKGPEVVHPEGRQLYLVYPAGIGRSKLTAALIEKTLGTRGTARNWNTVLKLAALTREHEAAVTSEDE